MTNAVLYVDPDDLSTSQQKKVSFRMRRIFPNGKVLRGMRMVRAEAMPHTRRVLEECPFGSCVAVDATFYCSYPKSTPRKRVVDGAPMPEKWDLDNKFKSVGDALTEAGWWPDDRFVTSLSIRKRRTTGAPRIEISVSRDADAPPRA